MPEARRTKDYDDLWGQIDVLEARVKKLERAMRKALGHNEPGHVTPLWVREMLMEGLRG